MNAASLTIHALWKWSAAPSARNFQRAMKEPECAQREVLNRILRHNSATEFGRAHGFAGLKNMEAYRRAVPPRDYADFQPWMDASIAGKPDMLVPGRPLAFLPTSGTGSGAKLIPWTPSLKNEFHAALGPWIHGFMRSHPAAWRGSVYWSLSPPVWPDDRTSGGIPVGFASDTSYLPAFLGPWLESTFAVPGVVAGLRDPVAWRHATLLGLLGARDLSMISVWSPSFLASLLEPLAGSWEHLLEDLENRILRSPGAPQAKVAHFPMPRNNAWRARELRKLCRPGDIPPFERIWPRLAAISCWTDAAAREPARLLKSLFPRTAVVAKGLMATEGVVSIPWPGAEAPALALRSHFFEFSDEAGEIRPAWDLREGRSYSVLLTTGGGLYRYRMYDRVQVAGFHERCPLLVFMGRDGVTSDLCGEKLAEPFVRDCLARIARDLGREWPFAMVAPSGNGSPRGYTLFLTDNAGLDVAAAARAADIALCENVHYAHARRIGQLACLKIALIPGDAGRAWAGFEAVLAKRGQKRGDIKPTALDSRTGWELAFGTTDGHDFDFGIRRLRTASSDSDWFPPEDGDKRNLSVV